MSISIPPCDEILRHFGVQHVADLGGRENQHWLVESRGARFVLRRWATRWASTIEYELRVLAGVAALGWPVPLAVGEPLEHGGVFWTLFPFLTGEPSSLADAHTEQRMRGRLLAELHADLARLRGFGQRGSWRRWEEILADSNLDRLLSENESTRVEEVRIFRWHLDRARERAAALPRETWTGQIVHGDFTPWNLRFQHGRLSAILDFELCHLDHRIADFALSWRGKYDEVIVGYHEVSPLAPLEWEALTPMWWAFLLQDAVDLLARGATDDGWLVKKLLQRSPLMGPDAAEYRI